MSKSQPTIEYFHPSQLTLNDRNPRKTLNLSVLEKSIERYGFVNPVIGYRGKDGKVHVVAGHHRIAAATTKGIDSIPVLLHQFENEAEAKAFGIMDNRSSEIVATWDFDILIPELQAAMTVYAALDLGFTDADIQDMLRIATMDTPRSTKENHEQEVQSPLDRTWLYVDTETPERYARISKLLAPYMQSNQLDFAVFEQMLAAWETRNGGTK